VGAVQIKTIVTDGALSDTIVFTLTVLNTNDVPVFTTMITADTVDQDASHSPELTAVEDSATVERGRYLVFGPAHCGACHAPGEMVETLDIAEEPPLSGGYTYPLPFGILQFPNITPDPETGIGRYTDGELARLLRFGVKPNGQALLPIMEYQNISDEDIVAIISYLRSRPPVRREIPPTDLNLMGKALKAFMFTPESLSLCRMKKNSIHILLMVSAQ